MTTQSEYDNRYGMAAFEAHNRLGSAGFYLMMAYKFDERGSVESARDILRGILATLDAALEPGE